MPNSNRLLQAFLWFVVLILAVLPMGVLLLTTISYPETMLLVLSSKATQLAFWHSLYTAVIGMLIAVVLGSLFAFIIVITDVRWKKFFTFTFMLPMMIPPQVTALAWLQLSGPASPLLNTLGMAPPLGSAQPLYSAFGIALLLGIQSSPLVFLSLRGQLIYIPQELVEASRINGAGTYLVWRDTIYPLSRAGLISGASLAFISSLGNFGIPAMLGIPISYYTLPTLIYQKMAGFGTVMLAEITALGFCIGVMTLIGILLQQHMLKRYEYALIGQAKNTLCMPLGRWRSTVEGSLALILGLILLVPLVALIMSSLVQAIGIPLNINTLSFEAYNEIIFYQQTTIRAFRNSMLLSLSAAIVLMFLSLLAVYSIRNTASISKIILLTLIDLPYALPGVVLAIACILLFVKPLPLVHINLYATICLIFIAYLMRFFSVAIKPVYAAAGQLAPSLEQAAQLAGAGNFKRMKDIFLPLIAPSITAGGILVFLIAVNELTVSALLWSAGNETLGVMVYNLEDGGYSVLAAALSVLIVVMVVCLMLLLSLFANKLPAGIIPWQEHK